MFTYFFPNSRKPVIPPPLNTINDPILDYKKTDDINRLESMYKKPRFKEESNYNDEYSNGLYERAKRGNKTSMINLNMGVDLARKGLLPNIPENQYIFEEMNRRDNLMNSRANREYFQQEEIRQGEFENLQQEHASKMSERIRQHKKRTRRQQEEEEERQRQQEEEERQRQQEEEERQRQQQEAEYIRQQQEERFRQAFEEQERLRREFEEEQERLRKEQEKEQERLRKEQEKEQERLRKEQERLRKEQQKEAERLRKEQEKEAERLYKEQQKEAHEQSQQQQNITDCPALKIDLPKDKSYCNKKVYKKLSLKLHPDKNKGCEKYSTKKFQELKIICDGNENYIGGKKKTNKKKTNKKKTKKRKQTRRKTNKKRKQTKKRKN
jgi:hypothetical protein